MYCITVHFRFNNNCARLFRYDDVTFIVTTTCSHHLQQQSWCTRATLCV